MSDPNPNDLSTKTDSRRFPLFSALQSRRSRRFGLGMSIPAGPLAYQSRHAPVPLSEDEEAALVFAACGLTGGALADLCLTREGGGPILAGLAGRTIASGDALQSTALIVTNDTGTYLIRRSREIPRAEARELAEMGRRGEFTEQYRRLRVRIKEGRAAPPVTPLFNLNINAWSAHAKGVTTFLPVNDLTLMYINGMLEVLNEQTGAYVLDERNGFRPAGLAGFARSRGGHLEDNPREGRVVTIRQVEQFVTEFVSVEHGMTHQNLALAAEALGLGGYPGFADHEFGWFQELGFRMEQMPASRYVGAGPLISLGMKLLRRDPMIPYPIGLERDGQVLLKPFCPPYYATMTEAVRAVVQMKFGQEGVFRAGGPQGVWTDPAGVTAKIPAPSEAAIAATTAYCEYIWRRYGRFPAGMAPYRTLLSFQACHLDTEFYDKFYRPEALSDRHRADFRRQTGQAKPQDS